MLVARGYAVMGVFNFGVFSQDDGVLACVLVFVLWLVVGRSGLGVVEAVSGFNDRGSRPVV